MGGSGTRAVVDLLVASGVAMGSHLDAKTQDSLPIRWFLDRHFDRLAATPGRWSTRIRNDFDRAILTHRSDIPDPATCWGWKNPRSMWILPFLANRFPCLRFIHLVRDGRDMALSENCFLLNRHGESLLGEASTGAPPTDQLRLWAIGNQRAAADGARLLGGSYLLVRYEDLCRDPVGQLARLVEFVGPTLRYPPANAALEGIGGSIEASPSLGRGGRSAIATRAAADPETRLALECFGYLDASGGGRA